MRKRQGQPAADERSADLVAVIRWLQRIGQWRRRKGEAILRKTDTSVGTQPPLRRKRGGTQGHEESSGHGVDHGNRV
jgi:hypothetical protein